LREEEEERRPSRRVVERRRYPSSRRRSCFFCREKIKEIDYKDADFLRRFLTDRGKIKARRKSAVCARHQRQLAVAIKRARHLALLPFTGEHVRGS